MIGHTTSPVTLEGRQHLDDVADVLDRALARHGIAVHAQPEYLHRALNGYDWDALNTMTIHTHGQPMHRPEKDCVRFRLTEPDEIVRLRHLLAGQCLLDPQVRPNGHRTGWQRQVDHWTQRVTLRTVGVLRLHPGDVVRREFVAAFDRSVEAGWPAPDTVTTSGRLLRRQLAEVTVPAGIAVQVIHRLRTCPPRGGMR